MVMVIIFVVRENDVRFCFCSILIIGADIRSKKFESASA